MGNTYKKIITTATRICLSALFLLCAASGFYLPTIIFAWIALVPLLILINHTATPKRAFFESWIAGFIFFLVQISWFLASAPLLWAGINSTVLGYTFTIAVWVASSLLLSIFIGIFGLILKHIPTEKWWYSAPALWTLSEYAYAWGFSIGWIGKESLLGPYWTFGNLGYAAVHIAPLLYFSKIVGLYGIAFLFAFSSVFLYHIVHHKKNIKAPVITALFFILLIVSFYTYHKILSDTHQWPIKKTALIQTNFPSEYHYTGTDLQSRAQEVIGQLHDAQKNKSELVILPESSWLFTSWGAESPQKIKAFFSDPYRVLLIGSERVLLAGPTTERTYFFDNRDGLLAYRDKKLLVPFGEYVPYVIGDVISLIGHSDFLNEFQLHRGYESSEQSQYNADTLPEGGLSCSAILSPALYQDTVRSGAEILVNSASHSIMNGDVLWLSQAEAMDRFIAASTDRFFLQSVNGGLAYIIDNNGTIIQKSSDLGFQPLFGNAQYRTTRYPAVTLGDWPLLLCFCAVLFTFRRSRIS